MSAFEVWLMVVLFALLYLLVFWVMVSFWGMSGLMLSLCVPLTLDISQCGVSIEALVYALILTTMVMNGVGQPFLLRFNGRMISLRTVHWLTSLP